MGQVWPPSTYREVILAVHGLRARPFSVNDVHVATDRAVSVSSIIRMLKKLTESRLLVYAEKRAYAGRQYHVAATWPNNVEEVIENYVFTQILKTTN